MENSITREIEIKAPLAKVWDALTDSQKFGKWFNGEFKGPFVAGKTTPGFNPYCGGFKMDLQIVDITPQTYFAYKWHPYPLDKNFDYDKEEPTLVEFHLEKTETGTLLKVTESGFNKISASRRAEAFKMHMGGWEAQLKNIEAYVDQK